MVAQGALQAEIGDYADGVSTLMRALAATEAATGRHSPAVAAVLVALADAHAGAGARSDLAAPLLERALGIFELALGPEVRAVVQVVNNRFTRQPQSRPVFHH